MKEKFNELTLEEMIVKREELKQEHLKLRCDKAASHVQNSMRLRLVRRQIAQLNTLIYNHEDIQVS